ncbi:TOR complex subunit lst8 [Tilletia horrida]|uniref:TOR complex subunit lst8 n=1 Tax=Tilletia horrida TaxID=155126 RepID=A0AAN6GR04_9BASI|nr:TOR complex subunit lst8 [Tilletia horrida]KAK0553328.1 TOR complex subunit lst8 [Tilletia horrida]KAK0567713.1 TOR complex subunit lst8 [Tilletia horrida]
MHHTSRHQQQQGAGGGALPPGGVGPTNAYFPQAGASGSAAAAANPGLIPAIVPTPPTNSESVLLVTAGYDHTIRFWQAWQSECTRIIQHAEGQVNRLAISPDRRLLAVAANQAVRIYDCTVNAHAAQLAAGIGPNGQYYPQGQHHGQQGGGGGAGGQHSQQGQQQQPGGNNPILTLSGHTGNVTTVCWQQDSKWLATSSEDGTVRVWDFRAVRPFRTYAHEDPVNDVIVHPNQGELISCDEGGRMKIWDLTSSSVSYHTLPEPEVPLRSVTVASDASILVAGSNSGKVYVWKMGAESKRSTTPPSQPIPQHHSDDQAEYEDDDTRESQRDPDYRDRVEADATAATAAAAAGTRAAADPSDPTMAPGTRGRHDDPTSATAAGFAPDQASLLGPTSSLRAAQAQAQAPPPPASTSTETITPLSSWTAHTKYLIRALLSPNTRYLATCGADTTIKIWNMENYDFSLEKTLLGHQRWVWDLAFSADSGFLVSASSDHVGRLWDISTGETVRTYTGHDKAIVAVALNDQDRAKPNE